MTKIPLNDEHRLVELIQEPGTTRQAWSVHAACQHLASDLFFPDEGKAPPQQALACCETCPVALHCLATALVHEASDGYRFGWWGGLSPLERDHIWAQLRAPAIPTQVEIHLRDPMAIARHLRDQSRTISAIAAELGCSERTVYRYLAASAA